MYSKGEYVFFVDITQESPELKMGVILNAKNGIYRVKEIDHLGNSFLEYNTEYAVAPFDALELKMERIFQKIEKKRGLVVADEFRRQANRFIDLNYSHLICKIEEDALEDMYNYKNGLG